MRHEVIVAACVGAHSVDELAYNLGIPDDEDSVAEIEDTCPGFRLRLKRNLVESELAAAMEDGDKDAIKSWRRELMVVLLAQDSEDSDDSVDSDLDDGDDLDDTSSTMVAFEELPEDIDEDTEMPLDQGVSDQGVSDHSVDGCVGVGESEDNMELRRPKGIKVSASIDGLVPVEAGDISSTPVRGYVMGYTGEVYCGRPVIMFKKCPEVFGCIKLKRSNLVRLTLHNGIINHMEIGDMSRGPTPYWAVLDAVSELGSGFTTEQVLSRALIVVGDDSQLGACRVAWYVLKSHQTHPKQRDRGMSFIIEEVRDGGKKSLRIRGRTGDESHEFYEATREVKVSKVSKVSKAKKLKKLKDQGEVTESEGEEVPLATHVIGSAR